MRSSLISSPYQSLRVSTRAFSLVELLVVISIIATLSIVAYVGFGEYSTSEKNSKRTADITALGGAVNTYVLEKKTLPEPTANRGYFDENGGYRHSNSGAYGVSSFLSEDILGTYALASHPRDPDTQSYYAYGRSYRTPLMYDLASVIRGNTPIAYLRGTSDGVLLPSLVKGYNTTTFVQDGDTSTLPYHPSQRVMTAYIVSSTGTITRTPVKPLSDVLVTGDRVSVSPGGLARIKSSDGSELLLGSETLPTEVNLSDLSLKDESGLLTRMRLVLTSGEIWIQAPKLREYGGERSDLELETRGVVAAVRGTVFGARAGVIPTSSGLFILSEGTLELTKDGSPLSLAGGSPISPGILDVPEGSPAKSIEIIPAGGPSIPPVKTLTPSEIISIKDSLDEMGTDSEESSLPEVTSYTGSTSGTSGYSLTLRLGRTRAESVRVDGVNTLFPIEKPAYGVYISNITLYQDPKNSFTFSLCKTGKVSGLKCGPSRTLQFGTLSSTPTLVDISDRTSSKIFLTPRVSECLTGEVLYDDTCRSWERIGGAMFETDTEFTGVSWVSYLPIKWAATLHTGVWNTRYRPKLLPIRQSNAWYFCDRNTTECEDEENPDVKIKNKKTYSDLYIGWDIWDASPQDSLIFMKRGDLSFTGVFIDRHHNDGFLSWSGLDTLTTSSAPGIRYDLTIRWASLLRPNASIGETIGYLLYSESDGIRKSLRVYTEIKNGKPRLVGEFGSARYFIDLDSPELAPLRQSPDALYTVSVSIADEVGTLSLMAKTGGVFLQSVSGEVLEEIHTDTVYVGNYVDRSGAYKNTDGSIPGYTLQWNDPIDSFEVYRVGSSTVVALATVCSVNPSNGSYGPAPSCTLSCISGYDPIGGACVASSLPLPELNCTFPKQPNWAGTACVCPVISVQHGIINSNTCEVICNGNYRLIPGNICELIAPPPPALQTVVKKENWSNPVYWKQSNWEFAVLSSDDGTYDLSIGLRSKNFIFTLKWDSFTINSDAGSSIKLVLSWGVKKILLNGSYTSIDSSKFPITIQGSDTGVRVLSSNGEMITSQSNFFKLYQFSTLFPTSFLIEVNK